MSLDELFSWPERYVRLVQEKGLVGWLDNATDLLQFGVEASSDFSGIDLFRETCDQLAKAFTSHLPRHSDGDAVFVFTRTCDKAATPLKVLREMSQVADGGYACVFGNICERVPTYQLTVLQNFDPSDVEDSSLALVKQRYSMMLRWLLDRENADVAYPVQAKSECKVHKGDCMVRHYPRQAMTIGSKQLHPERLMMNTASPVCHGWSSLGHHGGFGHCSEFDHNVWVGERAHWADEGIEDLVLSENTQHYPYKTKIREPLARTHRTIHIKTGSQFLGIPQSRTRVFSAALANDRLIWVGPESDADIDQQFHEVFGSRLELDGDDLMMSSDDVVGEDLLQRARSRKVSVVKDYWRLGMTKNMLLLPPGQAETFSAYGEQMEQLAGPSGSYLADLEQNEHGKTSGGGPLFPICITHGVVCSFSKSRIATGEEHLAAQGVNMFGDRIAPTFASRLSPVLKKLSRREQIFVAGNGLCVPAFGAFLLYVLGNIRRRPSSRIPLPMPSSPASWQPASMDGQKHQDDHDSFGIMQGEEAGEDGHYDGVASTAMDSANSACEEAYEEDFLCDTCDAE